MPRNRYLPALDSPDAGPGVCPDCAAAMVAVRTEYVFLERCSSCDYSRLLAWFSNDPLLLVGAKPGALHHHVWAGQVSTQGGTP